MNKRLTKVSKYLSFVLSHHPEAIGVTLDAEGWLDVEELVTAANEAGKSITLDQVKEIIATSEVKRFTMSEDGKRIKANEPEPRKAAAPPARRRTASSGKPASGSKPAAAPKSDVWASAKPKRR